jgi:hypothetical protein
MYVAAGPAELGYFMLAALQTFGQRVTHLLLQKGEGWRLFLIQ